jgi:hypothetical protein
VNAREKRLVLIVGVLVAVFAGVFGIKALFAKPMRAVDKKTALLRERLEKVKAERRGYFAAEDYLKQCAQRAFADQIGPASAKSGEMLTKQILRSGLRETDFSRLPVGPRKLRGASEIGWNVQGHGGFSDVVDLLFLLQESPSLHRIENVSISSGDSPGNVRVGFRFLTLVIDAAPEVAFLPLEPKAGLDSAERQAFDGIVERDLLRPYLPRPPEKSSAPSPTQPKPPGPESFRVVSLSDWGGEPEVHVRDLTNQKVLRYRVGDQLADGAIVMVDYRPLPLPGNDALLSFSRVIVQIGTNYWAIERGQTLADKRQLGADQLPESLPRL